MKFLITIYFLLFLSASYAAGPTNHYVSNTGNDANSGASPGTAWKSISKVNAMASTFLAGDSILFERGGTFYGSLVMQKSGSTALPIVIGAYGTGNRPILSGFYTLHNWTSVGTNLWECTPDSTTKANCNIVTFDGVAQHVGRTPWMVYQSATSTQLTSTSISATNYVGAEIVMKKNSFDGEKARVTAQSGTTVTYVTTQTIDNGNIVGPSNGTTGFGFFFQRAASTVDTQGEWYYNPSTNKMLIYSTSNPTGFTIRASYVDTIILLSNKQNIVVTDIAVEGGGMYGIESYGSTNVQVKNCYFNNNTKAVYMWNVNDALVSSCTLDHSFNGGILISNNQSKRATVQDNTITNTGQLFGMGLYWSDASLKGIVARTGVDGTSNFVNIIGNTVRKSGHAGIQFQGTNVLVRRNIVDSFCNQLDDNGGIYTFVNNSSVNTTNYTNRIIDSNFILNSTGAPTGANNIVDVAGYYMDDQTLNVNGYHNTIAHVTGSAVQMNNPVNQVFRDNTIYDCDYGISINKKPFSEISGVSLNNNVIYQKTTTQYNFIHVNSDLSRPTQMTIAQSLTNLWNMDSNWVSNQRFSGYKYYYFNTSTSSPTFPPDLTLAQWQSPYGHDVHSTFPTTPVLTATNSSIVTNITGSTSTTSFTGLSKADPKGNVYNHSIDIPANSSYVLIDNGNAPSLNKIPVVNAGGDITVTAPTTQVTLTATASDSDGVISAIQWVQLAGGPNTATIAMTNKLSTPVTNLVPGTYSFQITVTDNSGATKSDIVKTTVNPAANVKPTVTVGADQTIQLPLDSTTLTSTPADSDGNIVDITWTQFSGTAGPVIVTPKAAATKIRGLQTGEYQFKVTVTDNGGLTASAIIKVTVLAPVIPNQPPTANAGSDATITLPVSGIILHGTATDPESGAITVLWTKVSGGTGGNIASGTTLNPTITNMVEGQYTFRMTVTDNKGATAYDDITITVKPAVIPNQVPVVNAGTDSTITLPVSTSHLDGYAVDDKDSVFNLTYRWRKISGPSVTIVSPDSAYTAITGLSVGNYVFELSATDLDGGTGTDRVQVTVNAAAPANIPPVVSASANPATVQLPVNSSVLTAIASDADGNIAYKHWTKDPNSPAGGNIVSPDSLSTSVTSLEVGTYYYIVTVKDNSGDSATKTVQIIVNAAAQNIPPVVDGGGNKIIVLPVSTVSVIGTATDTDGTIDSVRWSKTSGPAGGDIQSPTSLTTNINNLQEGRYSYTLIAYDNQKATGTSSINIEVQPPVVTNQNPVVTMATNVTITLPASSTTISGSATDADGTISGYHWDSIPGNPSAAVIATPNASSTNISGLVQGQYQFQLRATDNAGGTSTGVIIVTVNPAPILHGPTVSAGAESNRVIELPKDSVHLLGSASDDGSIQTILWTKEAGPAGGTLSSTDTYATTVTDLVEGVYRFRITVTDNDGLSSYADILVTVNAPYVGERITVKGYIFHAD